MAKNKKNLAASIMFARQYLLNKIPYKAIFLVTGLLATIWFLIRVIPKPSRAGYPCMQAAAPLMSGFILYILSFSGSFLAFRKARELFQKNSHATAILLVVAGTLSASVFFVSNNLDFDATASMPIMKAPPDGANSPMGTGQGVMPGRVIWAWNPDATNEDFIENSFDDKNAFWQEKNNNPDLIKGMVDESILELTGASTYSEAWEAIFQNHNEKKHGEARGYQAGETIFIKINQGTSGWLVDSGSEFGWPDQLQSWGGWKKKHYGAAQTGPYVALNILRHLVNVAGVPQENIWIGDPMAHIWKHNFMVWYNEFPDVKYVDKTTNQVERTLILEAMEPSMTYSDEGAVLNETEETYFEIMEATDYMINIATLKAHKRAGITACAKNHFGSITRDGASHLHPSLVSTSNDGTDQSNTGYNKYRVQVDIMAHKFLGENTMLFILEGLFGSGADEVMPGRKWNMEPFNGDWPSSILMSLDQVALESVAYDFLRTEFDGENQPENYPNWEGVDDYLHQAADPSNRPAGISYAPDGEELTKSLGVHEHWNNATDKQYSRNLSENEGIELVQVSGTNTSIEDTQNNRAEPELKVWPNPFRDNVNISLQLEKTASVRINILDIQGRNIGSTMEQNLPSGTHEINIGAGEFNLSPGYYLLQPKINGQSHEGIKIQYQP